LRVETAAAIENSQVAEARFEIIRLHLWLDPRAVATGVQKEIASTKRLANIQMETVERGSL
jgi:hypothetical protein